MTADVCECGHLLQTHRGPCAACGCPVFVSEERPEQLDLEVQLRALLEHEEATAIVRDAIRSAPLEVSPPIWRASRRVRNRGTR